MAETPGALYFSHMRDGPLIRIRFPGGQLRAAQLRVIAELAEKTGNGRINLTNLGNFQVRGLSNVNPAELKAALGAAGLLPDALWADRLRNIVSDPLSGFDDSELIDTAPVVKALDIELQKTPILKAGYPKFSYLVDGGGPSGISAMPYDVGLIAEASGRGVYFRLYLAGHATQLCAEPDAAAYLAIAAARAGLSFAAPRDARYIGFLKNAGFGRGPGGLSALARGLLALDGHQETRMRRLIPHVSPGAIVQRIKNMAKGRYQIHDVPESRNNNLRPSIGVLQQDGGAAVLCGFGVPVGRLNAAQMRAIGDLADEYGRGELRLTPWHVIFIPHVDLRRSDELLARTHALGFITDRSFLHVDVSACSGREGCRGAKLDTPGHALAIMRAFAQNEDNEPSRPISIHVSGCPKGCAHRGVADILALEREDASGYYVYQRSTALAPDMKTRVQGCVRVDDLPKTVLDLAHKQRLAHSP